MDIARRREPAEDPPPAASQGFERHVPGIDYGVLDALVGYALRRAQIVIYEDFSRSLAGSEITPPRFAALVIIGANAGIRQSMLGRVMGIAGSGVVNLVDWLEGEGLVARRAVAGDRRASGLGLTPKGRRRLEALKTKVTAHDARIARRLSAQERGMMIGMLGRLG